ncbi:unnamed protein product [Clonostachys byssicola]|uniref:Transcription factor n=1 Tax=Clonostachys byssicola TaxID=160290 RepID=A0A9N9UPA9_9HYPO|nr:unnamed protein product [Clonostachys byssicola]
MSNPEMAAATGGGNNASDMLEDPSHQDVARWGKDGDTFVVVEGEKFTRSILPKHFKHSNMSSFIRQLNKYDFHKVKPSSDSENSSPLGNVLEFKHPYFKIDSKDDLDNIRRKAPAPRKQQVNEDFTTNHHISVMSEQLAATQQQVQQLQELFTEVSQTNKILVNEVLTLTKIINAQKAAQHEMLNYLTPYNSDNQRTPIISQTINSNGRASDADDASVPELRRARELLSSVSTDSVTDRELERLQQHVYGSPTDSSAMITPTSLPLMNDPMHDITRYPVYPVGQTVGIDPFHSDHIHKIPYAMPSDVNASVLGDQPQAPTMAPAPTQAEKPDAMWGPRKPSVFLVEDDPICAKIGIKFLKSMGCEVEHAPNGADAYTRINSLSRQFDMIFMDIIMPRLDGVSATMYIRQSHPAIPIIAMTSNIRPEEVNGYFEHGMNGVLAKPFTKEGMWKSVRTHLSHLMKNPPQESEIGSGAGYFMGSGPYLNTSTSIKFESPTPPSGTAGSNWSPGQIQQPSMGSGLEQNFGLLNGSGQYAMATGHRPQGFSANLHSADSSSGRLSDVESPPEKRQRLNPQSTYSC